MMVFDERFGYIPRSTLAVIRRCNVSPSDWDTMLARWGYHWNDSDRPFADIERHIEHHSQRGSYSYPMYED